VLQKTVQIVESEGFSLVHAIVDSVWVGKRGAEEADYLGLADRIQSELGLPVSFEGRYRWVVFLPSKVRPGLPALNKYYGAFADGRVKCRGIEVRRGDVPAFIRRCQSSIISHLAEAKNSQELLRLIPGAIQILGDYLEVLRGRRVDFSDLLVQKRLSRDPSEYVQNSLQSIAAKQLTDEGLEINSGESVAFLIVDGDNPIPERRVLARELVNNDLRYDLAKYEAMLLNAAANILSPLGYDIHRIKRMLEPQDQASIDYFNQG